MPSLPTPRRRAWLAVCACLAALPALALAQPLPVAPDAAPDAAPAAMATLNDPAPAVQAAQAARAAARRDLPRFIAHQLDLHPDGAVRDIPLALASLRDLKDARIGWGYPVYTLAPQRLLAGRDSLQALAEPTGQWRFVIVAGGQPIGLATVEQVDGAWQTVSYGAAVLARDLELTAARHGNAARTNLRWLRVYQARADYLEVAAPDGQVRFAPLHSARASVPLPRAAATGAPPASLVDGSELLQPLRAAVQANLAAFRPEAP